MIGYTVKRCWDSSVIYRKRWITRGYFERTWRACQRLCKGDNFDPAVELSVLCRCKVFRVMYALGGVLLATFSRSVEKQYHGRVGCNPRWHYSEWGLSTWRQVWRRRKLCGWIGYYNSLDPRLQNLFHYVKTARLLYSLRFILEIAGDLNTLTHGCTSWGKLWPMGR
jgi:hypothetical protein